MRVKNFLRNSIYAAVSYSFIAVISLLVRRCFVKFLSIDLLGYEGLFGNIFAIFSLADFVNLFAFTVSLTRENVE